MFGGNLMAKFDFEMDPELQRQLEQAADFENIAKQMLEAGVPILERNVISELGKHRRTGDMISSVKRTKIGKRAKNGAYYVVVRPTGKDRNGVRNMEKLAHAEYGTSKQPPTPILSKALEDSRNAVNQAMQDAYDKAVTR
jgi:HK97 gp10 family phage protein